MNREKLGLKQYLGALCPPAKTILRQQHATANVDEMRSYLVLCQLISSVYLLWRVQVTTTLEQNKETVQAKAASPPTKILCKQHQLSVNKEAPIGKPHRPLRIIRGKETKKKR